MPLDQTRQLRSWMFVPGNKQRFIDKAGGLTLDAMILDLEDGVPPAEKQEARDLIGRALAGPVGGPVRAVRVNAVNSEWFQADLAAILRPGLQVVVLPKVERPDEVLSTAARLERFEADAGLTGGSIRLVAAIESATGLLAAAAVAASHRRMLALMFGAEDFALDLGLGTDRVDEARQLLFARSQLVVAAAAARVGSIDGVFPVLDDEPGMRADVAQARRLGFTAKSTFHPSQVEEINRVFSPAPDEIAYARRVVAAFEEAQARGDGSVAVGGQLVDLPIVARAQRLLEFAASLDPASAPR